MVVLVSMLPMVLQLRLYHPSHTTHIFLTLLHVVVEFVLLLVTHLMVSTVQFLEDLILPKQPLMVQSKVSVLQLMLLLLLAELFKLEKDLLVVHLVLLVSWSTTRMLLVSCITSQLREHSHKVK